MLLLLISLVAGILTILAPCVLPLLPVIVGGSVAGEEAKERARPYVIATSLALSIIGFTLLLKVSTLLINLSPSALNYVSGGLLIALGAVSIFPATWEQLMIHLNWQAASQRFLGRGERNHGKYAGPALIGVALGPVFASCSPTYAFILASVLPHSFASGLVYLAVYSLGLVAALLLVALAGRKAIGRARWAVDTHSLFRRLIGILFVLIGVAVLSGSQIKIETWVANHLPFDETRLERLLLARQNKSSLVNTISSAMDNNSVLNVTPAPAPEFAGLTNWINSPPLTIAGLRGKVVLVDFWTYSCINCIRSLPYVEKWYQTYHSQGLEIVGVNTPEFAFEHNPANVQAAVVHDGIRYPVALDNNDDTWNAFQNDSWPADYLIDRAGNIRYVSLGEGEYGTTEKAIQELLGVKQPLRTPTGNVPVTQNQSPETYFGTNRQQDYSGSPSSLTNGTYEFSPTAAGNLPDNGWTLSGHWQIGAESITSVDPNAQLTFQFSAKDVYMVAGSDQAIPVNVGLPGDSSNYGSDAPGGTATVNGSRLYHIVSLPSFDSTTVTLSVPPGVSLYTFTFGS